MKTIPPITTAIVDGHEICWNTMGRPNEIEEVTRFLKGRPELVELLKDKSKPSSTEQGGQ